MLITLKILHYLAFSVGIGGGVANMIAGIVMKSVDPAARPGLGQVQARVGRAAFLGLVLLWFTGVWMLFADQGGPGEMGWAFWVKMLAVLALSAVAVKMQMLGRAARKAATPPHAPTMARLGMASGLASTLSVIFAVIAFH